MSEDALNGVMWDLGKFDFRIPYFGDMEKRSISSRRTWKKSSGIF